MDLVRPGFRYDQYLPSPASQFGHITVLDDLELLDRVNRRVHVRSAHEIIGGRQAVDRELIILAARPSDAEISRSSHRHPVETARAAASAGHNGGRQEGKLSIASPIER